MEQRKNLLNALKKRYEADMEEAKLNLLLINNMILEDKSDILSLCDMWIQKYNESKQKIDSIRYIFDQEPLNG